MNPSGLSQNCECTCHWAPAKSSLPKVVVTGGPGAGKTAFLELIKKSLCEHVAILPESASILFGGGFWRLSSASAKNCAQRAIFHVQKEMETLAEAEASWVMALCDRGSLDGLAYWQGEEETFFNDLSTRKEAEMNCYLGVLHLRSPSEKNGYNHQNPVRNESARTARRIDQKIHQVWSAHPNYVVIDSHPDFLRKVDQASRALYKMTDTVLADHCRKLIV